ncbi:class I SAM-dependent methyltransferase [Saccharothrix hoggarensis]|uniref:Class I SAM-dependent methyltransferase n=1 Tax=Saccharothrix hoggarensis TaxID=913853 RepID=A0ABW3QQA8_9PSEU
MTREVWALGDAYEAYVGRWSLPVARLFLRWLDVPAGRRWLDVGCGTGALTAAVLAHAEPAEVVGVDPADGFLNSARGRVTDPRVSFESGDARALPFADDRFDVVVGGLALNFVPDPVRAVAESVRVASPGGVVAAYVWDYAEGMAMTRSFWDAATDLDPAVRELDEGRRFPLCRPEPLQALWTGGGLGGVEVRGLRIPTVFADFDDFWHPFLGGQGPAPGYTASLAEDHRRALRDLLRTRLPTKPDGTIPLTARAWAVRGTTQGVSPRATTWATAAR